MANKKKIATSVAAVATAAALLLGGTFAWQSISQNALNEASDIVNPGGRLHDDFDGTNKDVYVENFADEPIYARVRLGEYFEIVINKGMGEGLEKTVKVIGDKDETTGEYRYDTFTKYKSDGTFEAGFDQNAPDDAPKSWWTWTTGGETVYMPTFNMNKDSLEADVNGTLQGPDDTVTDAEDDDRYKDYVKYALGDEKVADEVYDADANNVDDDGITTVEKQTHIATATDVAQLISMEEWLAELEKTADKDGNFHAEELKNYWVYDNSDDGGWVYYSKPIQPHTATGLLLSGIELNEVMDDSWYYAIQVTGQFITADDIGSKADKTGFYDTDAGMIPSDNALKLLKAIGVEVDDEGGGDEGTSGGEEESKIAKISISAASGTMKPTYLIKSSETYTLSATNPDGTAFDLTSTNPDGYDGGALMLAKEGQWYDGGSYIPATFKGSDWSVHKDRPVVSLAWQYLGILNEAQEIVVLASSGDEYYYVYDETIHTYLQEYEYDGKPYYLFQGIADGEICVIEVGTYVESFTATGAKSVDTIDWAAVASKSACDGHASTGGEESSFVPEKGTLGDGGYPTDHLWMQNSGITSRIDGNTITMLPADDKEEEKYEAFTFSVMSDGLYYYIEQGQATINIFVMNNKGEYELYEGENFKITAADFKLEILRDISSEGNYKMQVTYNGDESFDETLPFTVDIFGD